MQPEAPAPAEYVFQLGGRKNKERGDKFQAVRNARDKSNIVMWQGARHTPSNKQRWRAQPMPPSLQACLHPTS